MNTEEIRIKVNVACGWTLHPFTCVGVNYVALRSPGGAHVADVYPQFVSDLWKYHSPDVYNSLDACAEFERTLAREERKKYIIQLIMVVGPAAKRDSPTDWENGWYEITAIAPQRCEAFLRVKDLWTP